MTTTIPVPRGIDRAVAAYFARLRALQIGHDEGWFDLIAADHRRGRYLVEVPELRVQAGGDLKVTRRMIGRDAFWWVLGVGDGHGHGDLVLEEPHVPVLVDVQAAAHVLGQAGDSRTWQQRLDDIGARIKTGQLTGFYPGAAARHVAKLELLAAATGDPDLRAEWAQLRRLWPDVRPLEPGDEVPAGPPAPSVRQPVAERRMMALSAVSHAGLIRYLWADRDTDVYAASVVAGGDSANPTVRQLDGDTVTPWLRGICDRAGRADLIAGLE